MPDQDNMISALQYVAQFAADNTGPENPEMHRQRSITAYWCAEQAEQMLADRTANIRIGRQLYEHVRSDPGEQDFSDLGSMARHLANRVENGPTLREAPEAKAKPAPEPPGEAAP